MARQNTSSKKGSSSEGNPRSRQPRIAEGILDRLCGEEAKAVMHRLLERHPHLDTVAEQMSRELVSSSSVEELATEVLIRVTGVDLDDLNARAGSHSWGYVEPSEAAWELLEESVEDLIEDMKRNAEFGMVEAAEVYCIGIVEGLYGARDVQSEGALGWAPDFLAEQAGYAVEEVIQAGVAETRHASLQRLTRALISRMPEWEHVFRRIEARWPSRAPS